MKKRYLLAPTLTVLAGMTYLNIQNSILQTSRYDIVNEKIPESFNGFKVVHISDFHNVNIEFLRSQIIDTIHIEQPDMIVITGDFIDYTKTNIDIALDFIDSIQNVAPIYFVSGNHEGANKESYQLLKEGLIEKDVNIMDNHLITLLHKGQAINIVGLRDLNFFHADSINRTELMKMELNNIRYDHKLFTILLTHRPEFLDVYEENKFDFVFAGHAHGGQVRLPFVGGLYSPGQGCFPKYTAGVFTQGNTQMVVSRGIGNSSFPFRINNRPELVIVNFYSENKY